MNKLLFPKKLKLNDEVRVISPSLSMNILFEETCQIANRRFSELGVKLTFGRHVKESDEFSSSKIQSRIDDLHEAFADKNVKAIFTAIGGYNVNQLLPHIDYSLIKNNPKILCGYSDITALQNAILAKTGLVTYSGPHYCNFGMKHKFEWTIEYFKKCLFLDAPFELVPSAYWSDDAWFRDQEDRHFFQNDGFWLINSGQAQGVIVGANLCTFNLLQGTEYMPKLEHTILFIEEDALAKEFTPVEFDRNLQSLIQQAGFSGVKGILIGRFQKESKMTFELLKKIIKSKTELDAIPVIGNLDFGHTDPMITFPIGGKISVQAKDKNIEIKILEH